MDEAGFMRVIVADPDSDAPRLVYADWLDEQGRHERAEFIRVQCELAAHAGNSPRHSELRLREAQLLEANRKVWLPETTLELYCEWRRGLVGLIDPRFRGLFDGENTLRELAAFPLVETLVFRAPDVRRKVPPHPGPRQPADLRPVRVRPTDSGVHAANRPLATDHMPATQHAFDHG